MEFVTRYARIFFLSELADCRNRSANSVVKFNGFSHCLVRRVHAVYVFEFVQNFQAHLIDVTFKAMVVGLERHIEYADEKLVVVNEAKQLEMLDRSVHFAASFARKKRGQESVTALDTAFEQRFCKAAEERAEIVRCDVNRTRARRAQSHAYAVVEIEQHFGNVIARVPQSKFAVLFDSLLHEFVVGFLQKVFKVKQVFEIPHNLLLFFRINPYCFGKTFADKRRISAKRHYATKFAQCVYIVTHWRFVVHILFINIIEFCLFILKIPI